MGPLSQEAWAQLLLMKREYFLNNIYIFSSDLTTVHYEVFTVIISVYSENNALCFNTLHSKMHRF
jgi:hypothetical protein